MNLSSFVLHLVLCSLLLGWLSEVSSANIGNLVLLEGAVKSGAVCLDGSPPAYYIQKGSGSGANKWEIHHQGGGWCTSLENCFQRSQGKLGSSNSYPATFEIPFGYFSNDPSENPLMYNWNKVYLMYCDGGSFSGNNATVESYVGHPLYFRGLLNLQSYFESLVNDYGLAHATDVVIGGCSAGGLATYLHLDWWRSHLPKSAKVVGLPDSGFFLDYDSPSGDKSYSSDMRWVFTQMNSTGGVNQKCISAHESTGDTHKCFFAEHTAPFIETPFFPLQSQYDSWQVDNVLGSRDVGQVNTFGQLLTERFKKSVLADPKNGAFLDSCSHHCAYWGMIHIEGQVAATVFSEFYSGSTGIGLQSKPYPCDSCCH